MHIELILLLTAILVNLLLGSLVWYRAHNTVSGWFFAIIMVAVALWAGSDFLLLSTSNPITLVVAERFFYSTPMIIPVALLFFALTFPERKLGVVPAVLAGVPLFAGALALAINPHTIIQSVNMSGALNVPVVRLPLFYLYTAYFSITFFAVYIVLYRQYRREQAGLSREQLRYTFIGAILASVPALITNLSLPSLGTGTLIWLGPLFTTIFVVAIALSIVRHRMFDIRFFIVRAIAYIVTLAVLAVLFGVIVFGSAKLLFNIDLRFGVQVYISLGTALAALGFSSLKSFFDKMTNRLFYRDAYDTQTLLDDLNRILVANANIERLLKESATVIADNFKSDFCFFGIRESEQMPQRIIGQGVRAISLEDIMQAREMTPRLPRKIIVTDDLSTEQEELRTVLQRNNIAVLGRLTPNVHQKAMGLGYLVLGARKSGNPYTAKDVRTLEIIVNELVIAVENSLRFEEIQHFNETLQDNVSEATRKLRRTNEKLQGLDATKDEFITMASHQLRTPLTAVKGYLSMVLEGDAGKLNANQAKLLQQSYDSSQRMVYLIADLLNLSRLSTGKFVIEPVSTNLIHVVQGEVSQLEETARSREVGLVFEHPDTFPDLLLDETKVRQVVMNLIDNAIYYTPAGGEVTVTLRETATSVEYMVKDNGIGVPRADQRHLFSKFYRAENARRARPDGTGLGLFMAKKIIVAQGGAILFDTEEGKGSSFGFRFSKRNHLPPAQS